MLRSVRARLIVGNIVLLAIVLTLLGIILRFTLQQTLMAALDARLVRLAQPAVRQFEHRPPRPGPAGRPGGEFGGPGGPGGGPGGQLGGPLGPREGEGGQIGGPGGQGGQLDGGGGPFGGGGAAGPDGFPGPGFGPGPDGQNGPPPDAPNAQRAASQADRMRPGPPPGEYPPRVFWLGANAYDPALFNATFDRQGVFATTTLRGAPARVYSVPLSMGSQKVFAVLQTGQSLSDVIKSVNQLTRTLLLVSPIALLLAGLAGSLLAGRALRPVKQLIRTTAKIEATDLAGRIPVEGADEFAELSTTINGMFARLDAAFARQEEAIAQLRRFTADASHELRTPLTVVKANTSLALSGPEDAASYKQALEEADWAADRMNAIVQDLLLLARSDTGAIELDVAPVRVRDLIESSVRLVARADAAPILSPTLPKAESEILSPALPEAGSEILSPALPEAGSEILSPALPEAGREKDAGMAPYDLTVNVDRLAIERLLGNLLRNAQEHTSKTGRITIAAEADARAAHITVIDNGEGIAPQHLAHVFERFYRVDAARSRERGGSGLGLAICRTIAEAHGGRVEISSTLGVGTRVTVTLPR